VVYFAIMGRTPPPSVGRLLNDTYVPLVQAAAGRYSEQFLSAIDRALAVRPEERTQSIGELRQDLGLGEVAFDPYITKPLPPGTDMPQRTQAMTGMRTQTTAVPPAPPPPLQPQPLRQSAAAPAPTATPAVGVKPKGNGAMMGVGIGVVVLGALGFGAYALFAPKPRPAPPPIDVATGPVPAPAPASAALPPAPAPAPATYDVPQVFASIVKAQAPGFEVKLKTNKAVYRIEKDELSFTIQSDKEGYVYLFMYGSDQILMQLYPNIKQGSLKVKKGQVLRLPQPPDVFQTTGPAGPTDLLVMVSPRQRDHLAMRPKKDGAYRVFPTGPEAAALAAAVTGPVPAMAGQVICPANTPCDDEFGAALVRVDVVQ